MLALCTVIFGEGFLGAIGSYAIGTQIVFFALATVGSYALGSGLPQSRRSVLVLGMSTRNLGAALAPLIALPGVDQRATVMVVLGVPMQVIFSLLAAKYFARRSGEFPVLDGKR